MQPLDLSTANKKIRKDIQRYIKDLRSIARSRVDTVECGVRTLAALRRTSYEDLNQIQHEFAALTAIRWLIEKGQVPGGVTWSWNPRQTGDASEPDIQAVLRRRTIISGEVTTSHRPVGTIDKRMASTLKKLAGMKGKRFYFVLTAAMAQRANTKTKKAGYRVVVVQLPSSSDDDISMVNE